MEKDGRFWPTDVDLRPRVTRFHVPRSPIGVSSDEYIPGSTTFEITESTYQIEDRLREQFPLYKIASWGRELLHLSGKQNEV
ncbi:hypothetical protein KC950_00385 [Candidatus Saccharibacteria bacterium]|nr:hypothetical protein [Candidatus Saccharibacteria bacterium]